jgi:hypothetical protein
MTNLAVIPVPVEKVRPIRHKRDQMITLTPQEMLDLLKAARNARPATGPGVGMPPPRQRCPRSIKYEETY